MLQLTGNLLFCTLLAVTISPIVADYVIDVRLIMFENPNRLLANKRQCSNFGNIRCQTSLSICAEPNRSPGSCEYGTRNTGVIGDNIIDLNTTFVGTQRNPVKMLVYHSFEKFTVSFTAKDNQELIDKYVYNSEFHLPQRSIEEARYQLKKSTGTYGTGSILTYKIRSYCSQGYYGSNCRIKCDIPISEQSNFQCNSNGQKVCKPGFSGLLCDRNADVCQSSPCKNDATCSVQGSTFKCYCRKGYTGQYCNEGIDECSLTPVPCSNGGTCVDGIGDYTCKCPRGYTGIRCEVVLSACSSSPCLNGGQCLNAGTSFTCSCPTNFYGTRCEIEDKCRSMTCQNGGRCVTANFFAKCVCQPGFTGTQCEINTNSCQSSPCQNGGTCYPNGFQFTCLCPIGFTGQRCEQSFCPPNICQNGGTCQMVNGQITCICLNGFYGDKCQMTNQCYPPCQNGGACNINTRTCNCPQGFGGGDCSIRDVCASNPNVCQNGGTCQTVNSQISCICRSGFYGDRCQMTNQCYPPCQNGGACNINTRTCNCPQGFGGGDCSIRDVCASNPNVCQNGGTCQTLNSQINCICRSGFYGDRCQMTNPCYPPCQNGGACNTNTRICDCPQGFGGRDCSIRDPCTLNPCLNKGQCYVKNSYNYTCTCASGWTGRNCESSLTICATNPCLNGQCFTLGNSYVCACRQGWTGQRCEFQSNPCNPNPCLNNGGCSRLGTNDFTCTCIAGWYGRLCDQKNPVMNCPTNPCRNGGTCIYNANQMTCQCKPGFNGNYCEVVIPQQNFTCPQESGLFPDPQSCNHFYQCDWNHSYRKDCPGNLHFNKNLQVCDWPLQANCNIGK